MSLIERLARPLALAPRSLNILLAPQQLSCVVHQGRRPVDAGARQITVVNPGGHWQASLDALRALLLECPAGWAGLPLEISLSGRWSHTAVAPWSDALLSEPAAAHFLQSQLTAVYGDAARGWHIVGDDAPYGQARTVCGIDAPLPRAIRELAGECGHSCRVIEPLLCTALRSLNADELRAPAAALALIEPGRITMAALDRGRVTAIQSQPASGAWRLELPQAWQRWTLRVPELTTIEHVAVVDLSAAPAISPGPIVQLVTEALPPRFRIVAHPFGTADTSAVRPEPAKHADAASSGAAA